MEPFKTIRNEVLTYVRETYRSEIEYPWRSAPDYAVFRHGDNRKWYGLIMDIPKSKLGLKSEDYVDILNVKMDDVLLRDMLIQQNGFFPGYHIRHGQWISVLLDGTVSMEEIRGLIDISYRATSSGRTPQGSRLAQEWVIPANPKYYDIVHAFDDTDVIDWKQGSGIKEGDTVYIYVGAPVSAILFQCTVTECGIPYHYEDGKLTIRKLMTIRLLKRYPADRFTFAVLQERYDVRAVRGPRRIPQKLSDSLHEK